ncbi:hypothetical protein SPRA44_90019 [Serratia proteamaculans]|nr:hypothetical protein SPRA44_90019 [Serratia proteamaculans]
MSMRNLYSLMEFGRVRFPPYFES